MRSAALIMPLSAMMPAPNHGVLWHAQDGDVGLMGRAFYQAHQRGHFGMV